MKSKPQKNKPFRFFLTAVMVVFMVYGCARESRHKVLTFFFTGVPSLEEMDKIKKEKEQKKISARLEKQEKKENREALAAQATMAGSELDGPEASNPSSEPKFPPVAKYFPHTPYTEGDCDGCHKANINLGFLDKNRRKSSFSKGGGRPGPLVAPRNKLCLKCHPNFSGETLRQKGLWLHTPAAEGDCNLCHDPHQSPFPNQLLKGRDRICYDCHDNTNLKAIPEHTQKDLCLDCHNAHLGIDNLMLKADYEEKQ